MINEQFIASDSFLHKADSRVKIILTALVTIVISFSHSFITVSGGLSLAIVLIFFARLKTSQVLRRLLAVNLFTAFLWLTLPLTYGGESLKIIGDFAVSRQGLTMAALITLKTNCIVLVIIALVGTSTVSALGHALGRLGIPEKLCLLLLFSYRYIIVIGQEFQRLSRAAKIRGFVAGTNIHTYKTYAYLFAMTLVKSWNRAQRVQQAMILRGFNGRFYTMQTYRISPVEIVLLGAVVSVLIVLVIAEVQVSG